MTIMYSDGRVLEAMVLAHDEETLRVAVSGESDARTIRRIRGGWISEECDPVTIEFAWQRHGLPKVPDEIDCICPKTMASRLISIMLAGMERTTCLRMLSTRFPAATGFVTIKARWKSTDEQHAACRTDVKGVIEVRHVVDMLRCSYIL